jgi:ferredoxin
MEGLIIKKENLPKWLTKLSDYDLYLPKGKEGAFDLKLVKNSGDFEHVSQVLSDYFNSTVPPKKLLLPTTETIFDFKTSPELEVLESKDEDGKRLLFGVRPCDANSFAMLDACFYDEPKDCMFTSRRDNTTVIAHACKSPHHNCFCTSMGGGPASREGSDVLIVDLGDRYFVEAVTERGEEIVKKASDLFSKSTEEGEALKNKIESELENAVTRKLDVTGLHDKLGEIFESSYWEKVSKSCIGCGICTYLCPTCYCFDITDETKGKRGRRMRTWDTCMFPSYTLHASGHNPRPERSHRTRNRVLHKFRYYVDKYNITACVGCGRCINYCPVNIDLIELLDGAREVSE